VIDPIDGEHANSDFEQNCARGSTFPLWQSSCKASAHYDRSFPARMSRQIPAVALVVGGAWVDSGKDCSPCTLG
jgi:hypothetical protein